MQKLSGGQQGFTLVEVMAVLIVSGVLLTGMWNVYHGSLRLYQRGFRDTRVTQAARTVLTRLRRDVQQAFAIGLPYGIQGTQSQDPTAAATDRLALLTITSARVNPDPAAARGAGTLRRIRYALEPAANLGTGSSIRSDQGNSNDVR